MTYLDILTKLDFPVHKVLYLFGHSMEQKFFIDLFQVDESEKLHYDVVLDFPKMGHRLEEL
jgi:hypothetical protein